MSEPNKGTTKHFAPLVTPADVIAISAEPGCQLESVANAVAGLLNFNLLRIDDLYRHVALRAVQMGTDQEDRAWFERQLVSYAVDSRLRFQMDGSVYFRARNVTTLLRRRDVEELTQRVVRVIPQVERALNELQRTYRESPGLVAAGPNLHRVFHPPGAEHRRRTFLFHLNADPEVRGLLIAQQRYAVGDLYINVAEIIKNLELLAGTDQARADKLARMSAGAVEIDTSSMTVDKSACAIIDSYRDERVKRGL